MALITTTQFAEMVRKSPRWIERLATEQGLPRPKDDNGKVIHGKLDLVQAIGWYVGFLENKIEEYKRGGDVEKEARARSLNASATAREIATAKMLAQVITVDDTLNLIKDVLYATRQGVMALEERLPPVCAHKDPAPIKAIVHEYTTDALTELAAIPDRIRSLAAVQADDEGNLASAFAATDADGEPARGQGEVDSAGIGRGARKVENKPRRVSKGNDGRRNGSARRKGHVHDKRPGGKK